MLQKPLGYILDGATAACMAAVTTCWPITYASRSLLTVILRELADGLQHNPTGSTSEPYRQTVPNDHGPLDSAPPFLETDEAHCLGSEIQKTTYRSCDNGRLKW